MKSKLLALLVLLALPLSSAPDTLPDLPAQQRLALIGFYRNQAAAVRFWGEWYDHSDYMRGVTYGVALGYENAAYYLEKEGTQ